MTIHMGCKGAVAALAVCVVTSFSLAGAQPVLLQISPHVGDTLNVRMNQKVEMSGTPPGCPAIYAAPRASGKSGADRKLCADGTRQMTTVIEVFSRAIVHKTGKEGALVTAVTDSIRTSVARGTERNGRPLRMESRNAEIDMRVAPDGSAEVIDEDATDELRTIFGQMPAVLSRKPVSPGDTWDRQMRIPIAGEAGAMSLVTATFQLDSIGHNGDIAYISMRGKLSHDHRDGSVSELSGTLNGTMQLDRRLAWITDTRATIDATSTVHPAGAGSPMIVHTRVTQQLKAVRSQ